jgi:hypothetical protein
MALGFCHACYLGVSYVMVLRLPNISEGKLRKEPTKDYTLYQKDGRIFSIASGNYKNNGDCTKVESNSSANSNKNGKKGSLMNRFTGFIGKKTPKTTTRSNNPGSNNPGSNNPGSNNPENLNNETTPLIERNITAPEEENQGVFSKCSIL